MATVAVPPLLPIPGPCGRALQSHNPTNRIPGKFKEEIMNGKYDMTDAVNFIRDRCCTGDVEAAHPEWVVLRQGVYRRAEPNGPTGKDERDGTLIDWFERAHPRQAAAIKRRCGQPFL